MDRPRLSPQSEKRARGIALPELLLVGALVGLALGLRALGLRHSLWLDELHTAWVVLGPWEELPRRAALGNHGPVYFALARLAVGLFGPGEVALRSVSVGAGVLVVLGTFGLLRVWGAGLWLAGAAAVAAALDPQLLWFAQEARPYALLQAMSLGHVWLLWFWAFTSRGGFLGWALFGAWVLLGAAMLATHLVAVQVLVAEGLAAVGLQFWLRRRKDDAKKGQLPIPWHLLLPGLALQVLLAAEVWPVAWQVWQHRQLWQGVFPPWQQTVERIAWANVPLVGALLLGGLAGWIARRQGSAKAALVPPEEGQILSQKNPRRVAATVLATAWLLTGPVAALGATWWQGSSVFFPRYLTPAHAALGVAWGCWACWLPGKWGRRVAAGALVLGAACCWPTLGHLVRDGVAVPHAAEDWQGALVTLREKGTKGTPVLLAPGLVEEHLVLRGNSSLPLLQYLLYPLRSLYDPGPVCPWLLPGGRAEAVVPRGFWSRLRQQGRCFLLVRGSPGRWDRLRREVVQEAASRGLHLRRQQLFSFRGVGLWQLEFEKR